MQQDNDCFINGCPGNGSPLLLLLCHCCALIAPNLAVIK